ncbi:MAG TPA: PVC-type heme-binding CxxCH protein, partial [Roseimicrobium sp.]|nr:PVC-type heme-binding CxxCH protein [Roseimicrobium sp.]
MKLSYFSPAFLLLPFSTLIAADGPLTPADSLKQFHLEPGLRIEVVAAEPQVVDPVAMAFDEQGRLFVAEDRGYPVGPGEGKPPVGVVAMLEDRDGDGRYETRREFATGLTYPNGILPWRGGVFVTCAPDIYYLKDTDGDGRADIRQVVLTGFGTNSTTQLRVSHPTLGLDGWVYVTSGLVGGNVTSPLHPERPAVQFTKNDSRFNPDTYEFETVAGAGQFGLTMDDFGRKFVASNRNPLQQVMLQPYHLKRNPSFAFSETVQDVAPAGELAKVHPLSKDSTTASFMPSLMATPHAGTFTSACSPLVYRGDGLPSGYIGNVFVCEPAQNLVQRQVITPSGATFSSRAIGDTVDFLATEDSWFRPVFAANGPDGALYICDMYRKTLDHPQYLPEHIRAKADFESGKDKGRIYRIVKKAIVSGSTSRRAPRYEDYTAPALCELLSVPNGWLRDIARRSLMERKDGLLPDALRATVARGRSPEARTAALNLLRRLRELDDAVLSVALKDVDARVRENAVQLSESRINGSLGLTSQILSLAKDPDARVRFQVALTLGASPEADIVPALASIGAAAGEDRWTRAAVLSSVGTRADELFAATLQQ